MTSSTSLSTPHTPVRIAPTTLEYLPDVVECSMLGFSGAFPPVDNLSRLANPFRAPLVRAGVHPRRWPDYGAVMRRHAREIRDGLLHFTAFAADDEGRARPAGCVVLVPPREATKAARAGKGWIGRLLGDYVHPSVDAVQDKWWQLEGEATGMDTVFVGLISSIKGKGRNEYRLERDCYLLRALAVHPHMQRRGIGSALLKHCLALADAANMPIYLEASWAGAPLYASFGFQTIRTIRLEYKGEVVEAPVMVREPGGVGTAGSKDSGEGHGYSDVGLRARE